MRKARIALARRLAIIIFASHVLHKVNSRDIPAHCRDAEQDRVVDSSLA
jgi:hypothetical protein